ncbi:MAG: cytochrome c [Deltaproteobacteria bacterium]|nr:cytochrome c [Deltaproteobacteria bacterium]
MAVGSMRGRCLRTAQWIGSGWIVASAMGCLPDLGSALEGDGGVTTDGATVGEGDPATTPTGGDSDVPTADDGPELTGQALIDRGKAVFFSAPFDKGAGCASCHGNRAEGELGVGPYIRGKPKDTVLWAVQNVPPMVSYLQYPAGITDKDVDAVVAYLGWLKTQP